MLGYPFTWKLELQYELQKTVEYVSKASDSSRAFDDACAFVELFACRAAFMTRRLIQSGQLSKEVTEHRIQVDRLTRRPDAPELSATNQRDIAAHFDLQDVRKHRLPLKKLCNEIIHADIWLDGVAESESPNRLVGFLVASESMREEACHFVHLEDFFEAIEAVAKDGLDLSLH